MKKVNLSGVCVAYRSALFIGLTCMLVTVVPVCILASLGLYAMLGYILLGVVYIAMSGGEFFVAARLATNAIKYLPLLSPVLFIITYIAYLAGDASLFVDFMMSSSGVACLFGCFLWGCLNLTTAALAYDVTDNGYFWSSFSME